MPTLRLDFSCPSTPTAELVERLAMTATEATVRNLGFDQWHVAVIVRWIPSNTWYVDAKRLDQTLECAYFMTVFLPSHFNKDERVFQFEKDAAWQLESVLTSEYPGSKPGITSKVICVPRIDWHLPNLRD